jgi:cytoskeletal protein CcmA (bactofilin family)
MPFFIRKPAKRKLKTKKNSKPSKVSAVEPNNLFERNTAFKFEINFSKNLPTEAQHRAGKFPKRS